MLKALLGIVSAGILTFSVVTPVGATNNVELCHKTRHGNAYIYISVDHNAKSEHLAHGDFIYAGPAFSQYGPIVREVKKSGWCNNNKPTPTPTSTPRVTATPTSTPTATASATPSTTPSGTPVATPTNVPTGTPSATPTSTVPATPDPTISVPTSDGRSDGRTDSLGCQRPEDGCGKVASTTLSLPKTGTDQAVMVILISAIMFGTGVWLVRLANSKESSSKNQTQ